MRRAAPVGLLGLLLATCGGGAEPWVWHRLGTDAEFQDVFFLDSQRGWIVGGSYHINGGIIGTTLDGGQTWSFRSGIARPSRRTTLFHLNAVHFHDQHTGVIAADGGIVLRTIDGGRHWHEVHRGGRGVAHLSDLFFVDAEHGWIVGGPILLRTADGGESWESGLSSEAEQGFSAQAVRFLDLQEGWTVGRAGRIQHTSDGGETWTRVSAPAAGGQDLRDLDFPDPTHGWAVGERGTLLHSGDAGESWTRQLSGTTADLTAVRFVDASRGWAVGFDRATSTSTIIHTEDGGATWGQQSRVPGELLHALFLLDAGHGWAVGERVRPHEQRLLRYEAGP